MPPIPIDISDADKAKWENNPGSDTFDSNVPLMKSYLNSNKAYMTTRFSKLISSGIESIQAGSSVLNAPVEYFDMSGRKVVNPAHGIYVRRQGAVAAKVLIP